YANLPPGNYNFLVRAVTSSGNWSPVTSVGIDISAPWWLSTPAYVLYALLLLLMLAIPFLLFRMNRKRRNKAVKSSIQNSVNQETGTSINTLLISLENISEEGDQQYKHRLKNIVGRLRKLLEPVFNLQPKRIQDPKIEMIVVRDYMNALVHDLSPVLMEKNLEIIVNDQWNLEYFYYDVKYLNQIFFNIISNSIKNSFEKGKIIVNLIQTNRGDLKIQIADNGSGIPLEEQEVIRKYIQDPGMKVAKANYENIDLLYVKDLIDKLEGAF